MIAYLIISGKFVCGVAGIIQRAFPDRVFYRVVADFFTGFNDATGYTGYIR